MLTSWDCYDDETRYSTVHHLTYSKCSFKVRSPWEAPQNACSEGHIKQRPVFHWEKYTILLSKEPSYLWLHFQPCRDCIRQKKDTNMDLNLLCARHLSGNFAFIFSLKPLSNLKDIFSKGKSKAHRAEMAYAVRAQCLQVPDGSPVVFVCKLILYFFKEKLILDIG